MKLDYPKSWADVTIKQYYALCDSMSYEGTDEQKALIMLSALTGIDVERLETECGIYELKKAFGALQFIATRGKYNAKVILRIKGRKFQFELNLKEANAGSFISLSDYCKDSETTKKNIHNIIAIFCSELNFWGFKKKKTIKSQLEIANFLKDNMTMDIAFGYSDFFFAQLQSLIKKYSRLFEAETDEGSEGISEDERPTFIKHWGWYWTLDNMSNNDRTKWEYFLEMNVIEFLNTLAYYKDKQSYISEQMKKINK